MRKKRGDSFFGMHFDFHAWPNQKNIGENADPETIGYMLRQVRPDYVQCDTKGHGGASSYPTKVGNPCPEIAQDILKLWRDVTAENDVALLAHHSGVWDSLAVERHPDWAVVNQDGEISKNITSVFGPYVDELLIPQMKEMALDYGLDGVWLDGECWALEVDYSRHAAEAYKAATGKNPPKKGEADFEAYMDFNREGFRRYMSHYITEMKKVAPDFEIASNWMYTSYVPEKKTIPVDFISGDCYSIDSVNIARFEARCLVRQPQPWDIMAWCFNIQDHMFCTKSLPQMCQEASAVISLGGGFQIYNRQPQGSVQKWMIPLWADIAKFCREREVLCHRAELVPDVGVILSTAAFYKLKNKEGRPFSSSECRDMDDLRGTLLGVLNNQYSAEILMTHHGLAADLSQYSMLILPNVEIIEPDLREKLISYAEHGGLLIICGHDAVSLFAEELGIRITERPETARVLYAGARGAYAPFRQKYVLAEADGAEVIGTVKDGDEVRWHTYPAVFRNKVGAGTVIGCTFDLGRAYFESRSAVLRNFIGDLLAHCPSPKIRVLGTHLVDVALMRKEGQLRVNLLSLAGEHGDAKTRSFDEIPEIRNFTVRVKCPEAPASVVIQPEDKAVEWRFDGDSGYLTIPVEKLEIHTVICIS